ncbi:hypothetical protein AWF65_26290 [Escherichia coli]|nr:hypothetical protein AWF65_26290 [Escherichia coli]KZF35037.1 hypothetical protein AZE29_24290 [Escherichia coli APEC O2]
MQDDMTLKKVMQKQVVKSLNQILKKVFMDVHLVCVLMVRVVLMLLVMICAIVEQPLMQTLVLLFQERL